MEGRESVMPQTSRETVRAALRFEGPERLPVRMACFGRDDTAAIPRATADRTDSGLQIDEWGCRWEKTDIPNMGQPKGHPLSDVSEYERLTVPDYNEEWRYADCQAAFDRAEAEGKYTRVGIFMILFERMHAAAGFENVLAGLLDDTESTGALADRIVEAQLCLVRNYQERFGTRLDAFGMTEDWGTQQAAFVSTDLWHEFFFPRYKRIFDAMHAGGQDVWVHSCGKVNEIIRGYIDAGVDVVNLQQPRALGIEEIGRRYRGEITFESLADIQSTLPKRRPDLIEADARALAEHWMSPEGGFVFSDYGDGRAIGADPEAKLAMYRAFSRVSERLYGNPLPEPIVT
jgi:uroporphyrinogen decarboxylase